MYGVFGRFCSGYRDYASIHYGGIAMMVLGLVLIGAVVYFVWKGKGPAASGESPLDLLQKRFVNGEIGEDEYLMKRDILKK
jgi:putative membrane protein